MMGLDSEPQVDDIERFIPESGQNLSWIGKARSNYVFNAFSEYAFMASGSVGRTSKIT